MAKQTNPKRGVMPQPQGRPNPPKPNMTAPAATAVTDTKPNNMWFLWLLGVLAITFVCMSPTLGADFVNWDDDRYVTDNTLLQALNWETFYKIWTNEVSANYNPWAIWSLAIDNSFVGHKGVESAWFYHWHNLILHLMATALVYWWMRLLKLSQSAALIVTLLFGMHTMRVESVAWVTERKDVLFGFYYIAAAIAYFYYMTTKTATRYIYYLLTLGLAFMSCASKIQGTTFFGGMLMVDLLFHHKSDWSPVLGGFGASQNNNLDTTNLDAELVENAAEPEWSFNFMKMFWLGIEKIPMVLVSVLFFYISIQYLAVTMDGGSLYPLWQRFFFAPFAIFVYIWKFFTPVLLSACHPYPASEGGFLPWYIFASAIPILALCGFIFLKFRKNAAVLFGLGFFFINIAPLLQVVGAGQGFLAERFTYIAYIGFFALVGFFWDYVQTKKTEWQTIGQYGILAWIGVLGIMTFLRCQVWENSNTLWSDVLEKYEFVDVAYNNRGTFYREAGEAFQKEGRPKEAEEQFKIAIDNYSKVLERKPDDTNVHLNRGNVYFAQNVNDKAAADYDQVIQVCEQNREKKKRGETGIKEVEKDSESKAYGNRGAIYFRTSNYDKAIQFITHALEIDGDYPDAYLNRGCSHSVQGNLFLSQKNQAGGDAMHAAAKKDYEKYISLKQDNPSVYNWLGLEFAYIRDYDGAIKNYNEAMKLNPTANKGEYYSNRGSAYLNKGDKANAKADIEKAISMGWEQAKVLLPAVQ
jgi:protein O-mannosyl-transferase